MRWRVRLCFIICAVGVVSAIIGGVVLYRYMTPPLFASKFYSSEFQALPAWGASIYVNESQILALDRQVNMAVIIEAEDAPHRTSNIRPRRGRTQAVWRIDGRELKIEAERNTLIIIDSNEKRRTYPLPPGYVGEAIKRRPYCYGDFNGVFSDIVTSTRRAFE